MVHITDQTRGVSNAQSCGPRWKLPTIKVLIILTHLAIRWVLLQPGINTAVVGGRRSEQVEDNIAALNGDIPQQLFDQMTAISDTVIRHIPDFDNMFSYYP
ncbi:MAG: aldo/keto reductase [Anaerolineales bacterium]|nr:MAG: aldo/keto reductase [Anaerolineales bacterium]